MRNFFSIGIDFGTTYSVISYKNYNGKIFLLQERDSFKIPTVIAINSKNGEMLFGISALEKSNDENFSIIKSIKSALSNNLNDFHLIRCSVEKINNEPYWIAVNDKKYSIDSLIIEFFSYLKWIIEKKITNYNCVVTIPAYMSVKQKFRIKNLAKEAKLDIVRIINEPTAAILNFNQNYSSESRKNYIVYDLGGGTTDITAITINKGLFNVVSINGNNKLGGDDFDEIIKKEFLSKYKINNENLNELFKYIKQNSNLDINFEHKGIIIEIKKEELLFALKDIINETLKLLKKTITESKFDSIDGLILTGGMTRTGLIKEIINTEFSDYKIFYSEEPDFDISKGAAILCFDINHKKFENIILDVVPLSIGIELASGTVERICERNTQIPIEKKMSFTTSVLDQNAVSFNIVQGEREFAKDCESLCNFSIKNLPTNCLAKIDLIFRIDKDGIFSIYCNEKTTNQSIHKEVNFTQNINDEKISKMVKESLECAREDMSQKIQADSINRAKVLIKNIEYIIQNKPELFDKELIEKTKKEISFLKECIKNNDKDITSKMQKILELNDTISSAVITEMISEKMLKKDILNIDFANDKTDNWFF